MVFIAANCLTFLQYGLLFIVGCCDINSWCKYYLKGGVSAVTAKKQGFKKRDCEKDTSTTKTAWVQKNCQKACKLGPTCKKGVAKGRILLL